jgi:CSLREA domain-containing protein
MRKNILWLTILLMTSFALAQSLALIRTNASFSGASTPPAISHARNELISFPSGLARLFMSPPVTTYVVTTTADNLDNNSPTPGSLRAAIRDANLNSGADTIEAACSQWAHTGRLRAASSCSAHGRTGRPL